MNLHDDMFKVHYIIFSGTKASLGEVKAIAVNKVRKCERFSLKRLQKRSTVDVQRI